MWEMQYRSVRVIKKELIIMWLWSFFRAKNCFLPPRVRGGLFSSPLLEEKLIPHYYYSTSTRKCVVLEGIMKSVEEIVSRSTDDNVRIISQRMPLRAARAAHNNVVCCLFVFPSRKNMCALLGPVCMSSNEGSSCSLLLRCTPPLLQWCKEH